MRLRTSLGVLAAVTLALVPAAALAQDTAHAPAAALQSGLQQSLGDTLAHDAAAHDAPATPANADIIMPHITDSYGLEIPWPNGHLAKHVCIGHHTADGGCGPLWGDIGHIPVLGAVNLSPTNHVVMLALDALLTALVLIVTARAHARHHHEVGRPKGFASGLEAVVLFVRNEVVVKNVGHGGEGYAPMLLTFFFFILFANVLGLIPYGATATGNVGVTATLAIIAFVTIEIAGMRSLGSAYWGTIFYWPHDHPKTVMDRVMKVFLFLILTPVELLGKFTKPFALAIRLFANMTAGHVIVLAFIGMIFTFKSWLIAPAPLLMALAIMLLEVFVALLQAYIFTLLTSVFIGQMRVAHH